MTTRISGSLLQRIYYSYFLGPDHPVKLRLCRHLRKLIRDGRVVVPYNRTGRISVDEQDHVERYILKHGCYEPEVFEALMRFAGRQEVVWDVGAHVGSFTIQAMMDPRIAVTCAFEPLPAIFQLLARNVSMNVGNCVLVNSGLSDQPEDRLMSTGLAGNSGMGSMDQLRTGNTVRVRCQSIDALVEDGYLKPPTLMKIDVEGWERQVLEGAARTFCRCAPKAIVLEASYGSDGLPASPGLLALLERYRYRVAWIPRPEGRIEPRENYLAFRD